MNASLVVDERVTTLLRDAAEWRLLGRLFECPTREWRDDVARLCDEVASPEVRDAAHQALAVAEEGLHHSVFGPGGPAPPREASYHASVELGSLMSALAGEYAAFAYEPALAEPGDHIAVEVGFIAYLRLKQAFALAQGETEAAESCARSVTRFLAEHLAPVAHPLAGLLANSGVDYLAQASSMVAARSGPAPQPRQLPVIQPPSTDDDGGGEFACDI